MSGRLRLAVPPVDALDDVTFTSMRQHSEGGTPQPGTSSSAPKTESTSPNNQSGKRRGSTPGKSPLFFTSPAVAVVGPDDGTPGKDPLLPSGSQPRETPVLLASAHRSLPFASPFPEFGTNAALIGVEAVGSSVKSSTDEEFGGLDVTTPNQSSDEFSPPPHAANHVHLKPIPPPSASSGPSGDSEVQRRLRPAGLPNGLGDIREPKKRSPVAGFLYPASFVDKSAAQSNTADPAGAQPLNVDGEVALGTTVPLNNPRLLPLPKSIADDNFGGLDLTVPYQSSDEFQFQTVFHLHGVPIQSPQANPTLFHLPGIPLHRSESHGSLSESHSSFTQYSDPPLDYVPEASVSAGSSRFPTPSTSFTTRSGQLLPTMVEVGIPASHPLPPALPGQSFTAAPPPMATATPMVSLSASGSETELDAPNAPPPLRRNTSAPPHHAAEQQLPSQHLTSEAIPSPNAQPKEQTSDGS